MPFACAQGWNNVYNISGNSKLDSAAWGEWQLQRMVTSTLPPCAVSCSSSMVGVLCQHLHTMSPHCLPWESHSVQAWGCELIHVSHHTGGFRSFLSIRFNKHVERERGWPSWAKKQSQGLISRNKSLSWKVEIYPPKVGGAVQCESMKSKRFAISCHSQSYVSTPEMMQHAWTLNIHDNTVSQGNACSETMGPLSWQD